jgi:hypothetical protein
MYAKLPGGTKAPGGYVVPCVVINEVTDSRGGVCGAYIELSDPNGDCKWRQYVTVNQLLNDDEAES